jgi:hypothetical protein
MSQFDIKSPDNSTWRVTIDNDGILSAAKQP